MPFLLSPVISFSVCSFITWLFPERESTHFTWLKSETWSVYSTLISKLHRAKGQTDNWCDQSEIPPMTHTRVLSNSWRACQMMLDRTGTKQAREWLNPRFLAGDDRKVVQHDATWFLLSCLRLESFTESNPVRSGHMLEEVKFASKLFCVTRNVLMLLSNVRVQRRDLLLVLRTLFSVFYLLPNISSRFAWFTDLLQRCYWFPAFNCVYCNAKIKFTQTNPNW